MLQHMNHQIKSLPCSFICIDFQSLKINPLTMLTAFFLQLFQGLIQMLFLEFIRPCGMKFHHFFLRRIQDNMMVGMPFFRRMKSIGFQNLQRPLCLLSISHKQINICCLSKLRNRIKSGNGTALQRYRYNALLLQKRSESCIQYL